MKLAILVTFALSTCGAQPRATTPEDVVRARGEAVRIIRVSSGEEVSESAMLSDLAGARVIYLGERHDRATDHAMQHRIASALYSQDPALALGFEMFQTPYQNVLDDWIRGQLDEVALRRETEWDERWGHDFRLYRPILEWVRSRHVPSYALNAPREITRAVAEGGVESLDEETRAGLPELNTSDMAHRDLVMGALGEHAEQMSEEQLERMYTAQVIWDETMARSVSDVLEGENSPSRMLVLAGTMHVRGGLGIPDRVRNSPSSRIVLAVDDGDPEALQALIDEQPPAATYLWIVDPGEEVE